MFHSLLYRRGRGLALAALALLLSAGSAVAQSRIEGTVRNAQSRDPVPNARVTVVGTNLFGTTNENGYYAIESAPVGTYDVRVQVIGFQSVVFTNQQVTTGLPLTVNFLLQPSILRIEGVVVTGVAEAQQAIKLPFTVEQIGGEEIPVAMQTAEEAIRGKVAGARVIRGQGTPGGGVTVLLRGATSIDPAGRSNEPLYVVDGVILSASMVDIDALDIDNIEVVKGAAASALYGARAANGVISISTRRGRNIPEGETRVTLRTEFGVNNLEEAIPQAQSHWFLMNADQSAFLGTIPGGDTVAVTNRAVAQRDPDPDCATESCFHPDGLSWVRLDDQVTGSTDFDGDGEFVDHTFTLADNPFPGQTFDNLDRFYDPGNFYTTTISVTHRTGNTNFRASAHETQESGIVQGLKGYLRRGARVNIDHRIGRAFDFSASGYYSQSIADDPDNGEGAFYALNFYPIDVDLLELNQIARDSNDFLINPDLQVVESNPIYGARNGDEEITRGRLLANFGLRWRPIDIFDMSADFSFDRSDRNRTEFFFKGFRTTDASELNDGRLRRENSFDQAVNASLSATVNKSFGDFATITKARVLMERAKGEFFRAEAKDFVVGDVQDLDVGNQDEAEVTGDTDAIRSLGYFLSTQLDYKDRYIGDFLVRRDGSSLFGVDERWNTYYRASGAYRVSQEAWWPLGFMDEFKLRFSRGTAGGRPRFSAQYETFDVSGGLVSKGNLGNTDLKPEKATETEVGADMIIGGRLSIGITYADSKVENQLLNVPLAGFFGFSNQWQNAGTLESKTWEGTIQASIIQKQDLGWSMNIVLDRTRSKITEFSLPAYRTGPSNTWFVREGEVLGTMYGTRWAATCDDILIGGTFSSGNQCLTSSGGGFEVNDDGFLVPVGPGNTYTDGITQNLYNASVELCGTDGHFCSGAEVGTGATYFWGFPAQAFGIESRTLPDGTPVVDTTNFLKIGNSIPDFNFGIGNTVRFKGFSLYTLFDAQLGFDIYNQTRQWAARESNVWEADQAGVAENQKKPTQYYTRLYWVNATNSHYVEDGSFVKFRELAVGYTFNRGQLEGIFGGFMKRVSLNVVGRNLLTFTDYLGYDPEVAEGGDQGVFRFDGFEYPNYRTWTGAVEIQF